MLCPCPAVDREAAVPEAHILVEPLLHALCGGHLPDLHLHLDLYYPAHSDKAILAYGAMSILLIRLINSKFAYVKGFESSIYST